MHFLLVSTQNFGHFGPYHFGPYHFGPDWTLRPFLKKTHRPLVKTLRPLVKRAGGAEVVGAEVSNPLVP